MSYDFNDFKLRYHSGVVSTKVAFELSATYSDGETNKIAGCECRTGCAHVHTESDTYIAATNRYMMLQFFPLIVLVSTSV